MVAAIVLTTGKEFAMLWYLDLYSYGACLGTELPVNSYYDQDPEKLARIASQLLSRSYNTGVDEVTISRVSAGQNPRPISDVDTDISYPKHHEEEFVEGLI